MRRRADTFTPLNKIVYLDEDLYTYKYFMTGKFDDEGRKQSILAQQENAREADHEKSPRNDGDDVDNDLELSGKTPFFNKLQSLTDKISVFKSQFYEKKPRPLVSYDKVLKEKKLNFGTFKNIYGHSEVQGTRVVKVGN